MNHPNDAAPRNSGWQTIRDAISTEIQNGVLKPGAKLPTEPELCSLFGATRYAVRRAVEALAVDGKLRVEQGRGTFVESASKLNYRVGRRARFRQNLLSEGVEPDGEILSDEIVPASPAIAQACRFPLRSDPVFPSRIDPGEGMSRRAGFGSSW